MSVLTNNALSQFYCNIFSIYKISLFSSSTRYKHVNRIRKQKIEIEKY